MIEHFLGADTGKRYRIERELGRGGEGVVYLVTDADSKTPFAAKWCKPCPRLERQRQQIDTLVHRGPPLIDDPGIHFIWPLEALSSIDSPEGTGYLMPLIDTQRFVTINQISNGRGPAQPALPVLCRVSYRLATALESLHAAGLAYCDINQGNIRIDPKQGEIVISDNDNVIVNHAPAQVRGVWEFMAPEIALGQAIPNAESDLYSVAILLYYLWMWEHPMEGKETLQLYSWDIPAKKKYFAQEPVFVFHPTNPVNSAVGIPELALHVARWRRLCAPRLKAMFNHTFIDGIHQPAKRKRLSDWRRLFLELEANAPTCACGAVNLWDGESKPLKCWRCERVIPLRLCLETDLGHSGQTILLAYPGAILRRHHLDTASFNVASTEPLAIQEPHPKEPGQLIVRNRSAATWGYRTSNGQLLELEPDQARALIPGVELHVGPRVVRVRQV
jgi:DNA-binding helix-hairpin-helix protein with protein kinase domain